jgi:hypothetical protein
MTLKTPHLFSPPLTTPHNKQHRTHKQFEYKDIIKFQTGIDALVLVRDELKSTLLKNGALEVVGLCVTGSVGNENTPGMHQDAYTGEDAYAQVREASRDPAS